MAAEGGCWGAGGRKFITQLKAGGLCYFVSFRRPDAGIPPMFATVIAPDDFLVDDARVGLCVSELERLDGKLDQQAPAVGGFNADISWNVFLSGVPYTYNAVGTLDFSGYRYWFQTPPEGAGITDPCRGP